MTKATPAKLRDGSWGVRVQGSVRPGHVVRVTAKSGKSWDACIGRVVWTGEGVCLCSTAASTDDSRRSSYRTMGRGHGQAVRMPGYSSYCTDRSDCACYDCAS